MLLHYNFTVFITRYMIHFKTDYFYNYIYKNTLNFYCKSLAVYGSKGITKLYNI